MQASKVSSNLGPNEYGRILGVIGILIHDGVLEARYDEQESSQGSLIALNELSALCAQRGSMFQDFNVLQIMIRKLESPNFERYFPEINSSREIITLAISFYHIYEHYTAYVRQCTEKLFNDYDLTLGKLEKIRNQAYRLVEKMNVLLLKIDEPALPQPIFIEEIYSHYDAMHENGGDMTPDFGKAYKT